ncbi:MAG: hypothetical protein ACUVR2_00360 [Anaerolineae bacterium]
MTERRPEWAFISMGLNIAVVQGLLIRLLLVSFSGNELSIGLILANWMLAEAFGSHVAGRLAPKFRDALQSFILLQVLFAVLLLLVVCAGYLVRRLAGVAPGEALGFAAIFWTSLVLLAPLSAVHGAMFSIGCAACAGSKTQDHTLVGRLYVREAIGAMGGGVILAFVLVSRFNPIQIGLLLSSLGLATALLLLQYASHLPQRRGWSAALGLVAMLCLVLCLSPFASALHYSLVQLRWGGTYHIVYDRDSPYGNVAVTQLLGQYTFLSNGAPLLTTPFPDIITVEETVHLSLLFHPHPRRVLVIGGGLGGVLFELFKYDVEHVDYAELDPLVIEAVRAFSTDLTRQELQDPRLHVHKVDGRLFVNQWGRQRNTLHGYDIVLVNLSYPSTLELNRFYTEEFFQLVQRVLDKEGLAVFTLPGSLTYIGSAMRDLNLMVRNGLQRVFSDVRPIPGDTILWLASSSLPLMSAKPQDLVATWQKRGLPTRFITEEHLQVRFDPQRLAWFQKALQRDEPINPNHDLHPIGVLYGLAYWSEIFAPTTHHLLSRIHQIRLGHWCLFLAVLFSFILLAPRFRPTRKGFTIPVLVATTGFTGMACDLMVVFIFQALYGYVYQYVGLIVAAFMAGLALGGWMTSCYRWRRTTVQELSAEGKGQQMLMRSEFALIVYWSILPLLLKWFSSAMTTWAVPLALLLLNALGGCLVGLQFPLSSQLHLSIQGEPSYTAGALYAADLIGAFLGAIAVGVALLPVLGATETCLLVAIMKVCSLVLLVVNA